MLSKIKSIFGIDFFILIINFYILTMESLFLLRNKQFFPFVKCGEVQKLILEMVQKYDLLRSVSSVELLLPSSVTSTHAMCVYRRESIIL